MLKLLFKNLLLANYSFAKRWVNKKMPQNIVPATLHFFLTSFTFILCGILSIVIGSIEFKFKSYTPIFIFIMIIALSIGYGLQKTTRKALMKWNIYAEYKQLTKWEKTANNFFAFIFFWSGFAFFEVVTIKYTGGYLLP